MMTPVGTATPITVLATSASTTVTIPNENCGLHVSNCGTANVTFVFGGSPQTAVLGAGMTLPPNTWVLVTCNKATTTVAAIGSATGSTLYVTPVGFNG